MIRGQDRLIIPKGFPERRRRDIFVVRTIQTISSSVRSGIFRPDGALVFMIRELQRFRSAGAGEDESEGAEILINVAKP